VTERANLDAVEADLWLARVAAARVRTLSGQQIRLRELWQTGPVVTGFLRHFGCLFCHQMVADLIAGAPDFIARGASVVFVGNGSENQARRFFESKGLPREGCTVVTDPERESYQAAGFERGYVRTFLNSGSQRAYAQARNAGHRITGLFGDLTQLGGVVVTRPPALLEYLHRSEFAGDHPDLDELRAAVGRATR
jgi:peroxiredoxin